MQTIVLAAGVILVLWCAVGFVIAVAIGRAFAQGSDELEETLWTPLEEYLAVAR